MKAGITPTRHPGEGRGPDLDKRILSSGWAPALAAVTILVGGAA
jgi:hypothetical protein